MLNTDLYIGHIDSTAPSPQQGPQGGVEIKGNVMAGGTDAHITIALNLWALLRGHLRNSGCRAYALDMKVRIEDLNCFYYPDVMV
ncbi:MAG: Uma2 family endonuclease, partial [Nodosilinea sp.]